MNKSYNHGSQLLLILFLYTVSWINFNFVHMYIVGVATSIFLYSVSLDYSLKIEPIKKNELPVSVLLETAYIIFAILLNLALVRLNSLFFENNINLKLNEYGLELVRGNFLNLLLIVFAAPLLEEIIFRKILLSYIFEKVKSGYSLKIIIAVFLSSVIFALSHAMDYSLVNLLNRLVFGILASLLFLRTGRLRSSVVFHGLLNLVALL